MTGSVSSVAPKWRSSAHQRWSEGRKQAAFELLRRSLVAVGRTLPDNAYYCANASFNYLHIGRWMSQHEYSPKSFSSRRQLFDYLGTICSDERVLYLEFGVWDGGSMRDWSRLLRHPDAELHGFDSFQGLPEDFLIGTPAGFCDRGGEPPHIDDPRVRFHVGWFSETLPEFTWPSGWERLVVNLDADLYSSSAEALAFIEPYVSPGTIIYFDEFNHRDHELRAFEEFLARTGIRVRALGEAGSFAKLGFEVTDAAGLPGAGRSPSSEPSRVSSHPRG